MSDYTVRGRSFRTAADYQAALRDEKKIEAVKAKYESVDLPGKEHIIEVLTRGELKFETLVGDDFADDFIAKHEKKKAEGAFETAGNKKKWQLKAKKDKTADTRQKEIKTKNKKITSTKKPDKKAKKKAEEPKRFEDYDAFMQEQIKYEFYRHEKKRRTTMVICALIATVCIGYVGFYYYLYEKNSAEYEHLASLRTEEPAEEDNKVHINYTKEEEKKELVVLEKYKKLFSQNKSLIGWLKIDDTNIDYPVMQTVNNEYYLDHNYNQEYDKNGSIFLDKDCDITDPGTNMIIYGHHMKSGKMFGHLKRYQNKEYYEKHPIIQFDTIYEEGTYQVMYAFRSRVYNENEVTFKYYQFFDAATPEEFDSNMEAMAQMSFYDTGVYATYGDKLITLSTCDNTEEEGRFVVVAKKIN